jgi:hypothetical protein
MKFQLTKHFKEEREIRYHAVIRHGIFFRIMCE